MPTAVREEPCEKRRPVESLRPDLIRLKFPRRRRLFQSHRVTTVEGTVPAGLLDHGQRDRLVRRARRRTTRAVVIPSNQPKRAAARMIQESDARVEPMTQSSFAGCAFAEARMTSTTSSATNTPADAYKRASRVCRASRVARGSEEEARAGPAAETADPSSAAASAGADLLLRDPGRSLSNARLSFAIRKCLPACSGMAGCPSRDRCVARGDERCEFEDAC